MHYDRPTEKSFFIVDRQIPALLVLGRFIRRHSRTRQGFDAIQRVRQRVNPLTYEELADITDMWVDAALALTDRDLRLIDLLVRSQDQNAQAKSLGEMGQNTNNVVAHPARFG